MAVDFGTTYSGLAWAQTRKPEMQMTIIQWPDATSGGLEGITSDKVPTELQYDGSDYKWGYQIDDLGPRHQWFKLGLDPLQCHGNLALATLFPDPLASPPAYDLSSETLVTDYLTALRRHAEQILRYKLPQGAFQSTPLEFVITVPAVWSDAAQAKTRACAERAGMGSGQALHIITEPEAAAMYALDVMDPHNLKVGDTFVLCDAGGGTVDLISYTVSALKPILKITEASPGSGSLCGSTFLNRIFQKFLRDKFENDPTWDEDVLEEAMKRFEMVSQLSQQVKRSFRGTYGEEFQIPVAGLRDNPANGIRRGRLRLTGTEVRQIFEPVVQQVITLVLGQIQATQSPVKAVLLVGGFGQSAYLRDRVREAVGSVEVMQSPNGWTAVVRGALMKGLASTAPSFATVKVSGRSARKHYGISSIKPYDINCHDAARRSWHGGNGQYEIATMDWFIMKGSMVEEDKPKRLFYKQTRLVSDGRPTTTRVRIYVCPDPRNDGAPMYFNEVGVVRLVTVDADLQRVPVADFPTKTGADGYLFYEIGVAVEVTYYSAYTRYELIHNGVNYGAVTAEYV
ncbi:hypothetical protein MMC12_007470 [Toensbergia leucococca]|nr:hypothetical protein [Toensbergia leucococca]